MVKRNNSALRVSRRNAIKLSIAGAAWGELIFSPFTQGQGEEPQEVDSFLSRVRHLVEEAGWSPLSSVLFSLPELQVQPRPLSVASLEGREGIAEALGGSLTSPSANELIELAFPVALRYPAWLTVAISLELFELQLENSPLPAFEAPGVAREHVLPYTALIDQALIPACNLLKAPERPFSDEVATPMDEFLQQLQGRLVLLGDDKLLATAETLRLILPKGDSPVLLRVLAQSDEGAAPPFQARFKYAPQDRTAQWRFVATPQEWEKTILKQSRAVEKLVASSMVGKLFDRC